MVVIYKGEYWLFATKSKGYWHSKDFVHWNLVTQTNLPLDNDAPGAFAAGNKLYWTAINSGICETKNPDGGQWTLTNKTKSRGDPDLFHDTDGRVYLYSGCGVCGPISGQEVNPLTFKPLTPVKSLIVADIPNHGGEIFAEPTAPPPYRPDYNWTEGPWMTRHGGRYYLQYSAPGTELKSYNDGVCAGDSPLGPFTYAPYSPFSFKPTRFIAGAGHSTTFQDFAGCCCPIISRPRPLLRLTVTQSARRSTKISVLGGRPKRGIRVNGCKWTSAGHAAWKPSRSTSPMRAQCSPGVSQTATATS